MILFLDHSLHFTVAGSSGSASAAGGSVAIRIGQRRWSNLGAAVVVGPRGSASARFGVAAVIGTRGSMGWFLGCVRMASELSEQLQRFVFSEREEEVELSKIDLASGLRDCQLSLIGKIFW
ncbi:RHO guanyl-nucleotide exchange factor 13 [Striga asiatica]|uniref:RHO guanyl-nucleotide exchange factor 13 n=1 Tax=Striga asiatica TaxID=4170 RepID=A0A5A7R7U1_STRAF|nr:RHO guanyl-nucleotide exchange factor 13 [Striga asiatica]